MSDQEFYLGYRDRLETKLSYKNKLIARTERLLESLPAVQKPTFEALLKEEQEHLAQIKRELDTLYEILQE